MPDTFTGLRRNYYVSILEYQWASLPIVPAISAESAHTDFGRGWPRSGDAKFSAEDARRAGSASLFNCQPSTLAPEPGSERDDHRFPRRHRLTGGAELQAVARAGARAGTTSLDVRARAAGPKTRIGLVVPKYGHTAVQRNQLKRRLRELARTALLGALRASKSITALDVVVRARPSAYRQSFDTLRHEFDTVRTRLLRLSTDLGKSEHSIRSESCSDT